MRTASAGAANLMVSDNHISEKHGGKILKKWIMFASLFLGLCVITSGLIRPQMVAAYNADDCDERVHEYIAEAGTGSGTSVLKFARTYPQLLTVPHTRIMSFFDHIYDRDGACVTITHFWDPDNGDDTKNAKMWTVSCEEWNAWVKARQLWGMALGETLHGRFWNRI